MSMSTSQQSEKGVKTKLVHSSPHPDQYRCAVFKASTLLTKGCVKLLKALISS